MGVADEICFALAARAKADLAKARADDAARRVGQPKIDIDFYDRSEAKKPVEDYDFHAHGHHYQGFGARWAVWRYRWTGNDWRRTRRLSGPLQFTDALTRASELRAKAGGA